MTSTSTKQTSVEIPDAPDMVEHRDLLTGQTPEDVARRFIREQYHGDELTLRHWSGAFYKYYQGRYEELSPSDIKNDLVRSLQQSYRKIKSSDVTNVLINVAAMCFVLSLRKPPVWLDGGDDVARTWDPFDTFATRSHLINLKWLTDQKENAIVATSPSYFNFSAVDYEFDVDAPPPARWLWFLNELWPDEPDSIELLRQWMGYQLTCDTRQQKILLMVGPRRSGKGTIARVFRSIVGDRNCCAPTLSGLATNFGLSPLLGKSVAIIGDARLSGRTDLAATTERLLSISGEDAQTVDRKHRDPVTVQLPTRFTIISNELPRLNDASGALAGRLLILRLTKSFYGNEDKRLFDQLLMERQSILLWAIGGWRALREEGRFTQPTSGEDLVDQMEDMASPVGQFVREKCILDPNANVRINDLYAEYREWCEPSGVNVIPVLNHFSRDLVAAFPSLKRSRKRKDPEGSHASQDARDSRDVYFSGIKLR